MKRRLSVVSVSLGVAFVVACLRILAPQPLELLYLKILDFRYLIRGPVTPGEAIVIVAVDEKSLAEIGRWPWPRSELATLVATLDHAGAAVIGLDMVLDQPDESIDLPALRSAVAAQPTRSAADLMAALSLDLDNDARLAGALRRSGRTVLAHFFELGGSPTVTGVPDAPGLGELSVHATAGATVEDLGIVERARQVHVNLPRLTQAAAGAGHINFLTDPDGIYRRVPLAIRVNDRLAPAFSLEIMRQYLGGVAARIGITPDTVTGIRVGEHELPVDGAGQLWINYLGPPGTFPHVSAADVLAGRVAPHEIAGKIALVGFTATGFDEIPSPFAPITPGVELQATVLDNMLRGTSLRRPWWTLPEEATFIVVLGLVLGLVLGRLGILPAVTLGSAFAALYTLGGQYLFTNVHLAIGGAYPIAAIFLRMLTASVFRAFSEEKEKRWIRSAFRRYLNPEVTEILARAPERLRLGGERRAITILFADIREFTSISEGLEPEVLGELLNEYLGAMTDIVFRHEGLLDKYMGDAVMAFGGAPIEVADNAARCCRAALDMMARLRTLNEHWRGLGRPPLEIGIGVNTGIAVVGSFGSAERFSYTAVGDDVNLASRLEGLNKVYGTQVLISEETRKAVGDAFVSREIDW